jgi:hypothetical protein
MRTGSVCRINGLPTGTVFTRTSGISFVLYVLVAAYKFVFQQTKNRFLRERHGSQAVSGASSKTIELADHVDPENEFILRNRLLLRFIEVSAPGNFIRQSSNVLGTNLPRVDW